MPHSGCEKKFGLGDQTIGKNFFFGTSGIETSDIVIHENPHDRLEIEEVVSLANASS